MGICIFYLRSSVKPVAEDYLWSIGDSDHRELEEVFKIYNRRTGKSFDQYSDLKFPTGTLMPLKESLLEAISQDESSEFFDDTNPIKRLLATVEDAIAKNVGLGFYGD